MSEVQVDYATLQAVKSMAYEISRQVSNLDHHVSVVENRVDLVDDKIDKVNADLIGLWRRFEEFVKIQENRHNMDVALAKITHLRQEIEQKFCKHQDARTRLRGILDTADTGLLREHTIQLCSEQIMLDTPQYWLSPCLVALAAWVSNDEELAEKAVRVALDRDVEKTTLLFALICRRTSNTDSNDPVAKTVSDARQNACLMWLEKYFALQDPNKMKASVIVLVDAWRCGMFGHDPHNICKESFNGWMDEIKNNNASFEEIQLKHWKEFYLTMCHTTAEDYRHVSIICPEFQAADEYLARIRTADGIQAYFDSIINAEIDRTNLMEKLDEQLESLITDFDLEESYVRRNEAFYSLVEQCEGDMDRVKAIDKRTEQSAETEEVSFAQRLEDAVRSTDTKYNAARKTAISSEFLGRYINSAYTEYITEKKASFPEEITLRNRDWRGWLGKSRDGSNGDELKASFTEHMEKMRKQDIAKIPNTGKKKLIGFIVVAVIDAIIFLLGLIGMMAMPIITPMLEEFLVYELDMDSEMLIVFMGFIGFLAVPLLIILSIVAICMLVATIKGFKNYKEQVKITNNQLDLKIKNGCTIITAVLAQWVAMINEKAAFEAKNKTNLDLGGNQ